MQIADPMPTISIFSIQHGEEDKVTNTLQSNHLAYSLFYNEKKIVILTFFSYQYHFSAHTPVNCL